MKFDSNIGVVVSRFSLLFFVCLLAGCGTTEEASEAPECQTSDAVNCSAEEGEDRSYDPCLINKKLPVCKS